MPVYNASAFLKEAINSVLSQSFGDFEFIIINDGSTDESLEIIRAFTDPRIRLVNNDTNLGIIRTRNKGLQLARGEFIANMDADDISMPGRFKQQLEYLESNPGIAILATRLVLTDSIGNNTGVWPEDYYCISQDEIRHVLPVVNCIGQPTIMMRSKIVRAIGYNQAFKNNEDWGLWLEVLSAGHGIAKLPMIGLRYRQHPVSTTVSANKGGITKKILGFKLKYLLHKLRSFHLSDSDRRVLSSFIREILVYPFRSALPRSYNFLQRFRHLNKRLFVRQFLEARRLFKYVNPKPDNIYVFPFFHTGGAERVHASIVESGGQSRALTIFTGRSGNKAFYEKFARYSDVAEVDELLKLGVGERWLLRNIGHLATASPGLRYFGCNSAFFYRVIPYLPATTVVADLIHAFVHDYEDGPEKWSLPFVDRINQRVVISEKTKRDLEALYKKNGSDLKFAARIQVITNFVEPARVLSPKDQNILKVAYLGRGGDEKRVDLIAKVAEALAGRGIEFHFVGDVKASVPAYLHKYCIFHGEISDEIQLEKLYSDFHAVVIASSREGFPMVIMEGMMHGAVPVSTNVGGIAEHITDHVNGFLVPGEGENEVMEALRDKIICLKQNRQLLEQMSANALAYAQQNFNKADFFNAYFKILKGKGQ